MLLVIVIVVLLVIVIVVLLVVVITLILLLAKIPALDLVPQSIILSPNPINLTIQTSQQILDSNLRLHNL